MQATLDEATEPWGVKVERVEVKDVRLPLQLQRAMAAEAEAAREARAKVIVAEGEQKASRALRDAAEVIAESPQAIQLRYLQTLNSISAEKNSRYNIVLLPLNSEAQLHSLLSLRPVSTNPSQKKLRPCCLYKYPDWIQEILHSAGAVGSGAIGATCGGCSTQTAPAISSFSLLSTGQSQQRTPVASIRSAAADQQRAAGSTSSSSEATQQAQSGSQVTNIYSSGGVATPSRLHQPFSGNHTSRAGSAPNAIHRASTMPSSTASVGNVRFASGLSSPPTATTTPSGSLLKRALANRVMVQETHNSQARVRPSPAMTTSTASTTADHGASNGSIAHTSPTISTATRKGGTQSTPTPFSTIPNRKRAEFLSGDEIIALVGDGDSGQQRGLEARDGAMDRNQGKGQRGGSDEMSTSILASAAWYRDAAGRTGFQPEEWNWSSVPNLQSSVVKDMRGRSQADNNGEARRSPSSASLPPIPTTQPPMRTGYAQLRGSSTRESILPVPTGSPPSKKTIGAGGRGSFTPPTQTQRTGQQIYSNAGRGSEDQGNGDYDNLDLASFGVDHRVQASVDYDGVAAHIKSVTFSDRVEVNEIEGSFEEEEEEEEEEENDVRDELLAGGEEDLDLSNFDTERIATRPSLLELCGNATQLRSITSMAQPQSPSGSYDRIGVESPQSNGHREHTSLSAGRDKPFVVRSASGYLEANILASLANQLKEQSHQPQQPGLSSPERQLFPSHREADSKLQQSIYDNLVPSSSLSANPTTSSGSRGAHMRAPLVSSPFGSPDSCDSPPPAASSSEAEPTTTEEEEEKWLRAKFLAMYANRGNQLLAVGTSADPTQRPPKDPFQSPSSPPEYGKSNDGDAPLTGAGNKTATMTGRELERRTSFESALSSDSRESVVSAASIRAENKVRRYFNY